MGSTRSNAILIPGLNDEIGLVFTEEVYEWAEELQVYLSSQVPDSRSSRFSDGVYCNLRDGVGSFVGAPGEIENDLHRRIERAMSEDTRCVLIKGVSGSGKTTLLRHYFAKYRRSLYPEEKILPLWLNLKNTTARLTERQLFERLLAKLKNALPLGFALNPMMWENKFKRHVPQDLQMLWRQNGDKEEQTERLKMISSWSEQAQIVVEEYVAWWRSQNNGRVFLIVDNIDTMEQKFQSSALKLSIETNDKSVSPIASNIDCILITARPATFQEYSVARQIELRSQKLALPPVKIPAGVEKRLEFLQRHVAELRRPAQIFHSVELPRLTQNQYEGNAGRWAKPPQKGYLGRMEMLDLWSHQQTGAVLNQIANIVREALKTKSSGPMPGPRGEVAWEIFQYFCGRSMRRAVQLSRAILRSPGLITEVVNSPQFRPYVFLDALISTSFQQEDSSYVANVYAPSVDVSDPGCVFVIPVLCEVLAAHLERSQSHSGSNNDFDSVSIGSDEIGKELQKLGFTRLLATIGVNCAKNHRLLEEIPTDGPKTIGFNIKRNLVMAHRQLWRQAAYTDNVAQNMPEGWPDFNGIRKTVGYYDRDLVTRSANSSRFIKWLLKTEVAFLRMTRNSRKQSAWEECGCNSVSAVVAWNYVDRLEGIMKSTSLPHGVHESLRVVIDDIKTTFSSFKMADWFILSDLRVCDLVKML